MPAKNSGTISFEFLITLVLSFLIAIYIIENFELLTNRELGKARKLGIACNRLINTFGYITTGLESRDIRLLHMDHVEIYKNGYIICVDGFNTHMGWLLNPELVFQLAPNSYFPLIIQGQINKTGIIAGNVAIFFNNSYVKIPLELFVSGESSDSFAFINPYLIATPGLAKNLYYESYWGSPTLSLKSSKSWDLDGKSYSEIVKIGSIDKSRVKVEFHPPASENKTFFSEIKIYTKEIYPIKIPVIFRPKAITGSYNTLYIHPSSSIMNITTTFWYKQAFFIYNPTTEQIEVENISIEGPIGQYLTPAYILDNSFKLSEDKYKTIIKILG